MTSCRPAARAPLGKSDRAGRKAEVDHPVHDVQEPIRIVRHLDPDGPGPGQGSRVDADRVVSGPLERTRALEVRAIGAGRHQGAAHPPAAPEIATRIASLVMSANPRRTA